VCRPQKNEQGNKIVSDTSSPRKRKVIFVLGMGRSGTSAIARVLGLAGGVLPEKLVPAHESNPAGHWEPLEAMNLNDEFLFRYGSTWFDPTLHLQDDGVVSAADSDQFVNRIRLLFQSWPKADVLVIKEPRISALTEYWFKAALAEDLEIRIVIAVRHPNEVAASLATRDKLTAQLSGMLWLKYNLLSEKASRDYPSVFVKYTALLTDWRKELARISAGLSIKSLVPDETAIDAFLRRDLYREQSEDAEMPWRDADFPIGTVYQEFVSGASDGPISRKNLDVALDTHRERERTFRLARDEFARRFMPQNLTGEFAILGAELDRVTAQRSAALAELEEKSRQIEAARVHIDRVTEELVLARTEAQQAADKVFASRAKADQAIRELSAAQSDYERVSKELNASQLASEHVSQELIAAREALEQASRQQSELHAILGSRSWQLTQPFRKMAGAMRRK
jgi:hypothetical protein